MLKEGGAARDRTAEIRNYLGRFSASEITDRIRVFRQLNIRAMDNEAIFQALLQVLLGGGNTATLPSQISTYPASSRFFRIRSPQSSGSALPMDCVRVEADAWAPPANIVKASRLNKASEPMLYTVPGDILVAMEEARLGDGQFGAVFVYQSKRPVKVCVIGSSFEGADLSENERFKLNLINDFLRDEFTRDVGAGSEHLYTLSETVAKSWFDLPTEAQDAWCYPSVMMKPSYNVCFRPKAARECLRLIGALVGHRAGSEFNTQQVAVLHNRRFAYHDLGSEVQRAAFPDLVRGRT